MDGTMQWSRVEFGKHRGKTLPEIVFQDPGYFFWAVQEGVFRGRGALEHEARLIDQRARRIRVPPSSFGLPKVEYVYGRFDGRFSHLMLVSPHTLPGDGDCRTFRRDVIDLSVVRGTRPSCKADGLALISSMKSIVFGDANHRMTRQRCAAFFSRDENFLT